MATPYDSEFFEVIEPNELDKVLNVPLVCSLSVWVLEVREPLVFIWNIRKSLELISSERAFLKFGEKI